MAIQSYSPPVASELTFLLWTPESVASVIPCTSGIRVKVWQLLAGAPGWSRGQCLGEDLATLRLACGEPAELAAALLFLGPDSPAHSWGSGLRVGGQQGGLKVQLSQQLVCVVGASDGLWRERQEPQGPGCRLGLRALILRVFESLWGILENFCLNLSLGLNMGGIVREQLLGSVGPSPSPSWPKGYWGWIPG